MEERIQNLLSSLEAIKSNSALETQDYEMKSEEKSKITDELKAIQTDLEKSVDEFAVSFNLNLESSTTPPDTQEPPPPTQEPPPPPAAAAAEEEGEPQEQPPLRQEPTEEGKGNTGDNVDVDDNEEDPFVGGNRKQKTKKNKRRSQKSTQKNRKNN